MDKTFHISSPGKTSVEVKGDKITIKRKGLLNTINLGMSGEKSFRIKQLTSLQLKKGTMLTNGYLQFGLIGDSSHKQGLLNATQDENTLMFVKKHNDEIQELHDYIDNYEYQDKPQVKELSLSEELKELKELLDMEIITQEEFDNKKKDILNK